MRIFGGWFSSKEEKKRSEVMTRERRTPPPKKQATIIEEEAKLFWTERLFSAKSRQHWWQKRGEKSHLFAWTIQSGSDRLSVRRVAITKKHPHIHIRYAQYTILSISVKKSLKSITLQNVMISTTLQSMINTKLSKQRFGHCYENGLIKTIQTKPHNLYVSVKLTSLYCGLRISILVYPNPE